MKDQIISLETAKLANDKGFNIVYGFLKIGMMGNEILCTQSLLQRWLREKHSINILVHPHQVNNSPITYSFCLHYKYGFQSNMTNWSKRHKNYEEALEAGLIEGLKLIKI